MATKKKDGDNPEVSDQDLEDQSQRSDSQEEGVVAGLKGAVAPPENIAEGQDQFGVPEVNREQTDGHVEPSSQGAGDVGLATHDAHGGGGALKSNLGDLDAGFLLSGVTPEQTEASLRDNHTADALRGGQSAELVPGIEARLVGHGPDAQHRIAGHGPDDTEHDWANSGVPAYICRKCGTVGHATALPELVNQ
jgi:hypothetical protein